MIIELKIVFKETSYTGQSILLLKKIMCQKAKSWAYRK